MIKSMDRSNIEPDAIREITIKLWRYCEQNDFAGYDPYDALNSRLLKIIPGANTRFFRLALTQSLKRLPVNLRPLLLIPKTQNPKALAIFLKAALKLKAAGVIDTTEKITYLINRIAGLRSLVCPITAGDIAFPGRLEHYSC